MMRVSGVAFLLRERLLRLLTPCSPPNRNHLLRPRFAAKAATAKAAAALVFVLLRVDPKRPPQMALPDCRVSLKRYQRLPLAAPWFPDDAIVRLHR